MVPLTPGPVPVTPRNFSFFSELLCNRMGGRMIYAWYG